MSTSAPAAPKVAFLDHSPAPVIFFDGIPTMAHFNGVIAVSLSATLWHPNAEGHPDAAAALVAHLRTNVQGAIALRNALNDALLLASPSGGNARN